MAKYSEEFKNVAVASIVTNVSEGLLDNVEATIGQTELGERHRPTIERMMRSSERNLVHSSAPHPTLRAEASATHLSR